MKNLKRYIPDGTRDIMFEESFNRLDIEEKLRNIYFKNGYNEVISPALEYYDVFSGENQPIPQEKMFKLFDNGGRILVLRPDMTTPIGRIAATKLRNQVLPIKLSYNASIFRINEKWNGKFSEITQSGIEIIGVNSSRADAEVIAIGIKALKSVGVEEFKIEIGQAEFFKSLVEETTLPEEEVETLRRLVENKNFVAIREHIEKCKDSISQESAAVLQKLPELFGTKAVLDIAKTLTNNQRAIKAIESIEEVYNILKELDLEKYIVIDLGMVQHINYYTGIIFRGYSSEVGEYILSGGRYDNLIGEFGLELPATGLALNVDNIMIALKKLDMLKSINTVDFVLYYKNKDIKRGNIFTEELEAKGYICEQSLLEDLEQTKRYAKEKGIKIVINLKDDNEIELNHIFNEKIEELNQGEFLMTLGGRNERN